MEETIRVLVVDDSAQTRQSLHNILSLEKDMQVVGEAADGQEAVRRVAELHPDVVLMDVNMPGVDGIQATERITTDFSSTAVIIMSAAGDQDYVRKAMIAGARDYLIKPFTSDEVVTAIKRVHDVQRRRRQRETGETAVVVSPAKLIAIYSPHDGVGKTVVAANLAVTFVKMTRARAALVDLNLQFGALDLLLNVVPERTIVDVLPHYQQLDAATLESFLCAHESGVRMLAAPPHPQYAETITVYCVQQVLKVLKQSYQYVVVDCACTLNDTTLAALDLADEIVLIMNLDVPSLRNAKLCLDTMRELHYETDRIRLVINRAGSGMGITPEEVEEYLEHPVAARIPSDGRVVVSSVNQGIPFVLSHPHAKVTQAIGSLAQLLISALEPAPQSSPPAAASGLGARIRKIFSGAA